MAIVDEIEILRPAGEVFGYLTEDLSRHVEWEGNVVDLRVEPSGPARAGTLMHITRRVGPRTQTFVSEITEVSPPHRYAFRGIQGPIRAVGAQEVRPTPDGQGCIVTTRLDFEGLGLGRILAPLARLAARRQTSTDSRRLKQVLEREAR